MTKTKKKLVLEVKNEISRQDVIISSIVLDKHPAAQFTR